MNDLIRQTVSNYHDPRVALADAEQVFAAQSPGGLPGNDLFYEHVHLTFDGNYLLARTLAPELESLLPTNISARVKASQPWPSEIDCQRRLAWSDWDKREALSEIASRLNNPPFTDQLNHAAQVRYQNTVLDQLIPATRPAGIKVAQGLCENALGVAPDDPLLREQLAALDQLSGDLAKAAANAERAARLLPSSSEDWSQLGVILAKQQKYEDAAADFRRAYQLNPEDVWSMENRAQALKDLGRQDEAIREYRHALAVKPRFGLAWLGLGQMYEEMGRKAEADNCYQQALLNRIDRAPELTTLARFCVSKGWREAAATNYADAIKLNPADAATYIEAGQNLAHLGRHTEAEQCYARAVKLSPDSIQARFLYGLELGRDGKASDAAGQFREAVRIMPDLPEARFNLAMALVNAGDYSKALGEFNKVLQQQPGNAQALKYAQALRQKLSLATTALSPDGRTVGVLKDGHITAQDLPQPCTKTAGAKSPGIRQTLLPFPCDVAPVLRTDLEPEKLIARSCRNRVGRNNNIISGPRTVCTVGACSRRVPAGQLSTMFDPERVKPIVALPTVMEALVPIRPATVALIVALPGPTAVITPLPSTVSTPGLLLDQLVTASVTGTPETCKKAATTEACWV